MQKKYACVRYMHTRVTIYHPAKVDLRYSKALHSCGSCKFLRVGLPCSAIHYGVCQAVTFPVGTNNASSPMSPAAMPKPVSVHVPKSTQPHMPNSILVHVPKSVQPHRTNSVSVQIPRSAPSYMPNSVSVHVPRSTQTIMPNSISVQTSKSGQPPIPIPVVSMTKKPSPVVVVVSNSGGPARTNVSHITAPSSQQYQQQQQNSGAVVTIGHTTIGHTPVHNVRIGPAEQQTTSVRNVGPMTQVIVRTGPDGGVVSLPRAAGVTRPVGNRTPVRVVAAGGPSSKPATVTSPGLNFSFSAGEDEVYPAFPVSPEDKIQLAVPNGNQKDLHHGVLREKEPQPFDKDVSHGDHLRLKDSPAAFKDSKSGARTTTPTTTTTSATITLSPPSSSSSTTIPTLSRQEDKENKPKTRDLPLPRMPLKVRSEDIPPFHFPLGKPESDMDVDAIVEKATAEFAKLEGGKAYKQQIGHIAKTCGFAIYWKMLVFRAAGGEKQGFVTLQSFTAMLKKMFSTSHDDASRFVRFLARPGRMHLEFEDLVPLVQDVVDCHPGLTFLQDAPEFHSRYVHTVVSRIFFCVNRSWSGRITVNEIRKSNFLQTVALLEDEEDINQVTEYFSYEHFYVIYCKFWELDKDHDLFIDKADLARHNDHALNSRIIDRIFSGAVTRGKDFQEGRMSYKEFVWFLIAEEDKKHPTSIEYWFRCMDLDGDGVISMYEMEYFYEEQMQKMEALGIEKLPFEDCLCQMFDLVRPRVEERITLADLKNCRMANIFFDTFFNLDKFLEHEQRDPFANARDLDASGNEISDWDRYAAEEYDILVAEEGMNDQDEIQYEDDFEGEDDDSVEEEMARLAEPPQRKVTPRLHPATNDDIYDFTNNSLGF
ncbi:serine/threonine-protein phosphatase 2A regulatory subunit B'' subunit beta-like isoform X2 [Littorina saxatilis]|uniref:EF-hand domain-containing protein n=1 Tax=Littorina saxatilis TaxID=31220 RepID=A0AAN9ANP6_9CAEN